MLTAVQNEGRLAATIDNDGLVRVWDTGSRDEIARIESAKAVRAIALSNDGRWLATLENAGIVRLWALAPEDLIQQACRRMSSPALDGGLQSGSGGDDRWTASSPCRAGPARGQPAAQTGAGGTG